MSALYFYFSNKYRYFFSNSDYNHQEMIIGAMHTLIYAVATPIPDSEDWDACVYFRLLEATDETFLTIRYDTGCSVTVNTCVTFDLYFIMITELVPWQALLEVARAD